MTKGVVGIHGLGSQTNVWRNMTPFQVRRDVEEGLARHGHRCAPCVSQHAANLLNALRRTYIGVGVRRPVGSVPFWSGAYSHGNLAGDRVYMNTNGGRADQRARFAGRLGVAAGSALSAAQYIGWLGFRRGAG
jgi:hypothetical protein